MTMVWDLANGAGIPAPSDAIYVCISKHQSALIEGDGIPAPPQGRRPEDLGHQADEQKLFFAFANDELGAISEAFCSRWEEARFWSKGRSDVARNGAMGGQRGP